MTRTRTRRFHLLVAVAVAVSTLVVIAPPAVAVDSFEVDFQSPTSSFPEGVTGSAGRQVTVALTTAAPLEADQTVDVVRTGGSATPIADFSYMSPTEVTFPAGSTSATTRTVTINVVGDTSAEPDETVILSLENVSTGGQIIGTTSHTLTINNDDVPSLSVNSPAAVTEGDDVVFTVTLSPAWSQTVSVNYATSDGTAVAPDDYTSVSDSLTFAPGQTSKQVIVSTVNDSLDEVQEQFTLGLSGALNATIGTATGTGTINDNDAIPSLSVNSPAAVTEGDDVVFTVSLSPASGQTVSVDYATSNGTAVAPGDYTAVSNSLTFTPGQTSKQVTVATVNDSLDELQEQFTLGLSGALNATIGTATGTGTINDDDDTFTVGFVSAASTQPEGDTGSQDVTISVELLTGGPLDTAQRADVVVVPARTTADASDYSYTTTQVDFPAGSANGATDTVTISVNGDTMDGTDRTVQLGLSGISSGGSAGSPTTHLLTIHDDDNVAPTIDTSSVQTTNVGGTPMFQFETGQVVRITGDFTDPGAGDTHSVTVDWGDGSTPTEVPISESASAFMAATGSFEATHVYRSVNVFTVTVVVEDGDGGVSDEASRIVAISQGAPEDHVAGLVDPSQGKWYLYAFDGSVITSFFFGNPGDYPFMGDWDGDGIETPGLYRQSDGFVYLRNTNTQGPADIQFFFGNPGDVPIAGDFNGDGFDTVSIYRPSNQTFYIINELGKNNGGLGAAEFSYVFGNPGDKPFVGDFDGDGFETVGLHRESTGLVYFRNSHTQGNADKQFIFGDPGDRLIAGDWNGDGAFSPALFRPSWLTMYFRYTNSQGNADAQFGPQGSAASWLPVSGVIG